MAVRALAAVSLSLTLLSPAAAAEAETAWQSLDEIREVAEAYVLAELGATDATVTPRAGSLDSRLKLARCSTPLEAFLQDGMSLTSRAAVGVRCDGDKPWKLYVPVNIAIIEDVVTALKALPRGHLLTPADLSTEPQDVSRLTAGYVSRPEELIGKRLKQSVIAGRVLTPALTEADLMIRRGQSVTITAQSGGLRIEMAGTALADGTQDERIRVENTRSGRVVEAIVRTPEYVEVLFD